jgi:hypothetical protein
VLHIEIRVGDSLSIDNGRVVIKLVEKSGQRARFQVNASDGASVDPVRERPAIGILQPIKNMVGQTC